MNKEKGINSSPVQIAEEQEKNVDIQFDVTHALNNWLCLIGVNDSYDEEKLINFVEILE